MALQYEIVFGLLCAEVAICVLLCIPMTEGLRKLVLNALSKIHQFPQITRPVAIILFILFLDSIRALLKLSNERPDAIHEALIHLHNEKLFRSQRNFYLCGFTLLLFILMERLADLLRKKIEYSNSLMALKKQAEGVSAEYKRLLAASEKTSSPQESAELRKQLEAASSKINQLSETLDTAKIVGKEADVIKAHSEQLYEEIKQLKAENAQLKEEVAALKEESSKKKVA
eukprot:TRINITY_DN4207_c0_g1::TRINITY_DN4207_c0_g1_i1::g.8012::m.8012 TRINITY_DN4207_c0_g1::TRINITY_DN4207_c0_g1_i1::g.8012  ORF type:complete len:229 (+),score=74.42,sp/O14290/YF14_SCHPO/28.28/6e-13,Bap31/PF05529.7/3.4e-34,Bap31/PF05529.7/27,bZIP_2/PF07716.10/3.3e+03,bZIP_2/PF07716.10/6.4e+02,bZIP_2/PF07716.10/0.00033,Seryl_tRNA_N/PF02403.17/4.2e+02,Seryl_tRNA_N/PF02403.17/0.00035,IncA/PF04156.9/0.0009,bZIP_1/PF00170.16/6.3e+02,bZIP_1/PF00170.16/3.1e+02,bZIP_1/PF00170.16/0.00087,TBPIP/PF07106.8/0.019,T